MEPELRDAFRELRDDVRAVHDRVDALAAAVAARCARRGEQIAVLLNHDRERQRWVDRRLVVGGLVIAAVSALINLIA
jgi:hypothetical protein